MKVGNGVSLCSTWLLLDQLEWLGVCVCVLVTVRSMGGYEKKLGEIHGVTC